MIPIYSGRKIIEVDNAVEVLGASLACREIHLQACPQNVEDVAVGVDPSKQVAVLGQEGYFHPSALSAAQDRANDVFPAGIILSKSEPYVIPCTNMDMIYVTGNINDGVNFTVYR